jgi:hypothetical protein
MSIDLSKKAEKVAISLAKKGINKAPVMRVAAALDISPSMSQLYSSGIVEKTFEQLMGMGVTFDDDGQIDVWFFNHGSKRGKTASKNDFGTYIKQNAPGVSGSTSYAPVLGDVVKEMTKSKGFLGFGSKPSKDPTLLLFITDGSNDDEKAAEAVIRDAQDKNIYFQLIGIGNPTYFRFIEKMGEKYPNCGYINMASLSMSDDALYAEMISDELVEFCRKFV